MGQRVAVQEQQWWPITTMAQANLRAAGLEVGQRKAGHDFHRLYPCRFYGDEALAGPDEFESIPAATEVGRESRSGRVSDGILWVRRERRRKQLYADAV